MSEVTIERKGDSVEFSAPSINGSVRQYDDGREWLTVTALPGGMEFSMLDNGAGGEYTRSYVDIVLDRQAALELRGYIAAWLDSPVSLD